MLTTRVQNEKKLSFYQKMIFKQLELLKTGTLYLKIDDYEYQFGEQDSSLIAKIEVKNDDFFVKLITQGSIGFALCYINKDIEVDDLYSTLKIFTLNIDLVDNADNRIISSITHVFKKIIHYMNKNTISGSAKNIHAHYDLGNDFFKLFLDSTMMYSSAVFDNNSEDLYMAQLNKLQKICERANIQENDHILEIGSGWGAFALYAVQNYNCTVTTTTISKEQYNYCHDLFKKNGVENRITLLLKDYRNLEGKYDKIVSIEMIEAVGHHYYKTYFNQCSNLLKSGGNLVLQAITIQDQKFSQARNSVDFIKKYIFPGCCIPSSHALLSASRDASSLNLVKVDDIGEDYAKTLLIWRENFSNNLEKIRDLGFSEEFILMWDYYFVYCAAGFATKYLFDLHMVFTKW